MLETYLNIITVIAITLFAVGLLLLVVGLLMFNKNQYTNYKITQAIKKKYRYDVKQLTLAFNTLKREFEEIKKGD